MSKLQSMDTDTSQTIIENSPICQLGEFYKDVLPPIGVFGLWTKSDKRNHWYQDQESLIEATHQHIDNQTQGVYFATAAFNEQAAINGDKDARTQVNVTGKKSFYLDLDAGEKKLAKHGPEKVYATKKEALADAGRFFKETGLTPTYLISSGEGLHVYWVLDEAIEGSLWTFTAKKLSKLFKQFEIKADPAVTSDSARVLRPLGTVHENGTAVKTLTRRGPTYSHDDFQHMLTNLLDSDEDELAPPPKYADKRTGINADVIVEGPPKDFRLIIQECAALARVARTRGCVEEPYWRAAIGVAKHCVEGDKVAHYISSGYAGYDHGETQRKLDNWKTGPATCAEFSKHCGDCKGCPQWGNIKSPISLGYLNDKQIAQTSDAKPDNQRTLQEVLTAAGIQVFMDTDGQLNIVTVSTIDGRNIRTCQYADSEPATDAILTVASASGSTPSDRAIETFKAKARHSARQRGKAVRVYLRVAEIRGVVYVDHKPGWIARIDERGWTLVDDTADGVPMFRRGMGVGALPKPEMVESAKEALDFALDVWQRQFGLSYEQALAITASALNDLRTETPHTISEFVGPAGSGKSSLADFKLSLTDPTGDGKRVTTGTDSKDIAAAAQQRYALQIDNAGKFDKSTSDLLCIVATGGTLLVRVYYKQTETANLCLHRVLIVTSVSPVCIAPDLQSRVNRYELAARDSGFVAEEELKATLEALKPRMLGSIYTLLSGALRELPGVQSSGTWEHRLVDFDQIGESMVKASGLKPGTFLTAVGQMRERMARRTASGDLFLIALLKVLRKLAGSPTHATAPTLNAVLQSDKKMSVVQYGERRVQITTRPSALHKLLPSTNPAYGQHNAMPATERGLTDAIRRVQPLLDTMGIKVQELASGTRSLIRFDSDRDALNDD